MGLLYLYLEDEAQSENIDVDGKIILQQVSEEIRSEGVSWIYLSQDGVKCLL